MNLPHKVLFTQEQIAQRVKALAEEINRDYQGSDPLIIIAVLKGSFMFLADLIRHIKVPTHVEFMGVSSYQGTQSTGHVRITQDLSAEIKHHDVLLVEDIVDTGITIDYLINTLRIREPKSIKICTFLSKPAAHKLFHKLDYVGFEITNEFVIGYGLDLDEKLRNLPEVVQVIDEH